jgi:hypothetical protein
MPFSGLPGVVSNPVDEAVSPYSHELKIPLTPEQYNELKTNLENESKGYGSRILSPDFSVHNMGFA